MIININGTDIFYEKSGSGPPFILLHGNGETHKIFNKAVPLLAERFTVYALDTRGHGQSGKVSQFHYADIVGDVRCFAEALGLESPALYGFSDGGIVGLLLAAQYPNLLSRLIVSGANLCPNGIRAGWLLLFKLIYRFTKDPKIKMILKEPNIAPELLQKITIPTLVLAGSRDMVKRGHTKEISAAIPGSELRILPWQGHGSYIVNSSKIARILYNFTD